MTQEKVEYLEISQPIAYKLFQISLTYWFGWNDEVVHKTRIENFRELKLADVIPVFKQADTTLVENYNPISLYVNFLQVF